MAHVLSGASLAVEGAAGTGKTVVLRVVQTALEQSGVRCQAICLTHTGARKIGSKASTAHGFVVKHVLHGTFGGGCVLIDEVSFMSLDLLAALEHLRLKGVRLITFGVWGQLGPVSNRWCGQSVPAKVFEASRLAWHWSGGNRFVLQRCRRSDQAHFDFCCGLREMALADALEQATQRYPPKSGRAWSLVMRNFWRRQPANAGKRRKEAQRNKDPHRRRGLL